MRDGFFGLLLAVAALLLFLNARLPEGATRHSFAHGSVLRSYVLYAPEKRSARPALVVALHGKRGSGVEFERRTRQSFDRQASHDGAIVVYPDALFGQWNAGHPSEQHISDDLGFLAALIAALSAQFGVDPERVYVTGYSNGASMAYRFACERPDLIAAVAPVSGGLAREIMPRCPAGRTQPVPLLLIHGTADPTNPFDDGELEGNLWQWAERNGCDHHARVSYLPDAEPEDRTRTRVERYEGCSAGNDVTLYAIEGAGHHWPGDDGPFRSDQGTASRDFDAAVVIWDFFRRHPET